MPAKKAKRARALSPAIPWRAIAQGPGDAQVYLAAKGSEFDELCVGGWLHLERMDARSWSLILNDRSEQGMPLGRQVSLSITVRRDGRLKVVVVEDARGMIERAT